MEIEKDRIPAHVQDPLYRKKREQHRLIFCHIIRKGHEESETNHNERPSSAKHPTWWRPWSLVHVLVPI
jgi:hypothetical protein